MHWMVNEHHTIYDCNSGVGNIFIFCLISLWDWTDSDQCWKFHIKISQTKIQARSCVRSIQLIWLDVYHNRSLYFGGKTCNRLMSQCFPWRVPWWFEVDLQSCFFLFQKSWAKVSASHSLIKATISRLAFPVVCLLLRSVPSIL